MYKYIYKIFARLVQLKMGHRYSVCIIYIYIYICIITGSANWEKSWQFSVPKTTGLDYHIVILVKWNETLQHWLFRQGLRASCSYINKYFSCLRDRNLSDSPPVYAHTEKYFRNIIKSNRNLIVFTMHRLVWNQTNVRFVPN